MGDIVAFSTDIEQMGVDFGNAASGIYEVLAKLDQATEHVRHAFQNHPDEAGPALAPFTQLHTTIEQVEQLASALGVTLIDVGHSYRSSDAGVASGWKLSGAADTRPGSR